MGRRELLEALQREGRETMAAISVRSAADEERLVSAAGERRVALRDQYAKQCELCCSRLQQKIISKASREAGLIRLRAEYGLSLRLLERARFCVMQMRAVDPEKLFCALVAELPEDEWLTVRVNPGVVPLATACFPDAEIIVDEALSAGLKVTTADGTLSVDNTLSTRLERLWPELLPLLMVDLRGGAA